MVLKWILGMWLFTAVYSSSCSDIVVALPAEAASSKRNFVRDSIVYFARSFLTPEVSKDFTPGLDSLEIAEKNLPEDVRPTFELLGESPSFTEIFDRFRGAEFSKAYLKYQSRRQPHLVLPSDRMEFEKQVGLDVAAFSSLEPYRWSPDANGVWLRKIIPVSKVKGKMRVLYRRSREILPPLSVAVTHDKDGKPTGEMEITLKRGDGSGHWDFYVYGPSGKLTTESVFFTSQGTEVIAPAPYTCMACHYDTRSRAFQRFPSQYNGRESLLFSDLLRKFQR